MVSEQEDLLARFMEELRKPTGDGAQKRDRGTKPPWYEDDSHWPALHRHLEAWQNDEGLDPDSQASSLVHMAWRCLAIACIETGNTPLGPEPYAGCQRKCGKCGIVKSITGFPRGSKRVGFGRGHRCLVCHSDETREGRLGLSRDEFDELLERQGGRCAICQRKQKAGGRRFAIDHDHRTGRVRAVLCGSCNSGLGLFDENVSVLGAAIEYLQETGNTPTGGAL